MLINAFTLALLFSSLPACQPESALPQDLQTKLFQSSEFLSYVEFMDKGSELEKLVMIDPYEMEKLEIEDRLVIVRQKKQTLEESGKLRKAMIQYLEANDHVFEREPSEAERQVVLKAAQTFIDEQTASEAAKEYVIGRFEMSFSPKQGQLKEQIWQRFPSFNGNHRQLTEWYLEYSQARK